MKKGILLFFGTTLLLFLALCTSSGNVKATNDLVINEENFPAEWLRNLLGTKYYDLDSNGVLSKQELEKITVVQNYVYSSDGISQGIVGGEYLGATSSAIISGTDLSGKSVLDVRGLEKLSFCRTLNLAEITCTNFTISTCPESLKTVQLANAEIDLLEISGDMIKYVYFPAYDYEGEGWAINNEKISMKFPVNYIKKLDISNCSNLQDLCCDSPTLTTIDISQNKKLKRLSCQGNQLSALDVSNNTKLNVLECGFNQLKILDLRKNIRLSKLKCEKSGLRQIKWGKNKFLKSVYAKNNKLTSLDIPELQRLVYLDVSGNQLKKIDVSQNGNLSRLFCAKNQLKKLDLSQNKKMQWVTCRKNKIRILILPNINWRKYGSNEQASENAENYYSLFGQNPIKTLDLRAVTDFRQFKKKTVLQFMNGKYNWWESEESHRYMNRKNSLHKIKKLIISRKLSANDRIWLEKQAKKYKINVVCI